MPYRHEMMESNTYYHIYNRGNNKREIFFEPHNYRYMLDMMFTKARQHSVEVHCYCFMPNHFHIIVRTGDTADIPRFMRAWMISYVKAVNKRYSFVGHLFQDRYKIKHIDSDAYLLHLSRYIHINPLNAGLVLRAEDWAYSSYRDYIEDRQRPEIITDLILSFFEHRSAYRSYVESYKEGRYIELSQELWKEGTSSGSPS